MCQPWIFFFPMIHLRQSAIIICTCYCTVKILASQASVYIEYERFSCDHILRLFFSTIYVYLIKGKVWMQRFIIGLMS